MYCRKCKTKEDRKVSMNVELKQERYVCSKCDHVVEWSKIEQ